MRRIIKFLSLLVIITLVSTTIMSCKKKEITYLNDPIGIVYKNKKAYIINRDFTLFDLSIYDTIVPYFGDILIVKKNNKFGYIKNTGEPITDIIFDEAYQFAEDKAVVSQDGYFYIIDKLGNPIYTFEEGVSSISSFSQNLLVISKDEKQGYLKFNANSSFDYLRLNNDEENNLMKSVFVYDYCGSFNNDYAVIGNLNSNNELKYSHINKEGKRLYELEWSYVSNFYDGLAVVGDIDDYDVKVYSSRAGKFDTEVVNTVEIMNFHYVSTNGTYLGETIDGIFTPYTFAWANDYNTGLGLVSNLYFHVDSLSYRHTYNFATNSYFYNYSFIDKNGQSLFGSQPVYPNNWGSVACQYKDFFQLNDYYITTFYQSGWYFKFTKTNELNAGNAFKDLEFDLRSYTSNEKILEDNPWVSEYVKNFTNGKVDPLYVADHAVVPYNLSSLKKSFYFDNRYVAKAQVFSGIKDSCGLISVYLENDTPKVSYVIPPLYDEIIY